MSSRHQKLVDRFLRQPRDFRWLELVRLLAGFGYWLVTGGKTSGSVRRFEHDELKVIVVHKPHPGSIIKPVAMRRILEQLKERKLI